MAKVISGILRDRITGLRLRPDAPWPSQVARRQRYRMKLLRAVKRHK